MPALLRVYAAAHARMAAEGNAAQWTDGYPECVLERDIKNSRLYVICGPDGAVCGAFAFCLGDEPTYAAIEDGAWPDDRPYGTIHRLAGDGTVRGLFAQCLAFCGEMCPVIRADTHKDNGTMRHLLEKHGFTCCGTIHVADGTPRMAYQYPSEGSGKPL